MRGFRRSERCDCAARPRPRGSPSRSCRSTGQRPTTSARFTLCFLAEGGEFKHFAVRYIETGSNERGLTMASTINESRRQTELDIARDGVATRVFLQPIAAPSVLGLFGFAGATFIVASNMAGWWGTPTSGLALAPFAAMFGGLAQFVAANGAR